MHPCLPRLRYLVDKGVVAAGSHHLRRRGRGGCHAASSGRAAAPRYRSVAQRPRAVQAQVMPRSRSRRCRHVQLFGTTGEPRTGRSWLLQLVSPCPSQMTVPNTSRIWYSQVRARPATGRAVDETSQTAGGEACRPGASCPAAGQRCHGRAALCAPHSRSLQRVLHRETERDGQRQFSGFDPPRSPKLLCRYPVCRLVPPFPETIILPLTKYLLSAAEEPVARWESGARVRTAPSARRATRVDALIPPTRPASPPCRSPSRGCMQHPGAGSSRQQQPADGR